MGVAEVSEPREHAGAVGVDGGAGATTWLAKSMKSRPPSLYGMASGYPVRSRFSMGDTNDHHRDGADQNARGSWLGLFSPSAKEAFRISEARYDPTRIRHGSQRTLL